MRFRLDVHTVKIVGSLLGILVFFLGGIALLRAWEEEDTVVTVKGNEAIPGGVLGVHTGDAQGSAWYNGHRYVPKSGLELTLILGIDNFADEDDWLAGRELTQSDFMMLVIVDRKAETCTVLHVNRDTMGEYRLLTTKGVVVGTEKGQLTLAHTYGGTEQLRCENVIDAVSRLLNGIRIDHYVSLMMDGVAVLNDLAGGVTLEVMDDLTALDPTLVQGETVTLKGKQALTYIRSRMGLENATNVHRMERQRQYLECLQAQLSSQVKQLGEDYVLSTMLKINPYMTSDCTVEQLSALVQAMTDYGIDRYLTLEGEVVDGERFAEFHVDEDALQAMIMEQFYVRQDS